PRCAWVVSPSEREVIGEFVDHRRCLPCWLALPLSLAIQHLQLARDDLGGVTVGAVLGLPLPGAQTALNVYLRALAQVLASDLGQAVEKHHVVPLGALLHLRSEE